MHAKTSVHLRGVVALALLTSASVASFGCGARTTLRGGQPCYNEGEERACEGYCGAGTQLCENGFWTGCTVPPVLEPCEGVCGVGERTCADEAWSECDIPPVSISCEGVCGVGEQTCVDEVWSGCVIPPTTEACSSKCGTGERSCVNEVWGPCSAPQPLPPSLQAVVRDFHDTHPDFETPFSGLDQGIVTSTLGADEKPVYAGTVTGTATTTGSANFYQWYNDVEGINVATVVALPLTVSPSDPRLYEYIGNDFFPIDGQLFGNEGRAHNYHFTLEASGDFVYQGGETFEFTGDDDVFVYINGQLVIDLGGLHESETASVNLDAVAGELGLFLGQSYPIDLFFAERKTVASNFNIRTSIAGLGECP